MGVPEEGTAGKHRVKNLGHQLHTIKNPKPSKGFSCKPTYMLNWKICFPQTSGKVPVLPL